jgi:hypothetical protein
MLIKEIRNEYHKDLSRYVLSIDKSGVPNNADRHSKISIALARGIIEEIDLKTLDMASPGQTSGKEFERLTAGFLEKAFAYLNHLRYGKFNFFIGRSINTFEQYEHLALLSEALNTNKQLRATLGDYLIKPDIVIGKYLLKMMR